MNIAMIDNYDSFTYNLVHLGRELGVEVTVFRNDQFELPQLDTFDKIMLSPGPGIPCEAGKLLDVIRTYSGVKPILGICLGEQAIGEVFGGTLTNLSEVFHGVQTPAHVVYSSNSGEAEGCDVLFREIDRDIMVGRYHSWVVDAGTLPDCLEVTCVSDEGQIMALRHKEHDVRGIQFHPESVLTPEGKQMIKNWIES